MERKENRGFKMNLDGLLEFSCRMRTTKEEEKQLEQYPDPNHGLHKITLKDYQHQSIHWMIMEERSKGGILQTFLYQKQVQRQNPILVLPVLQEIMVGATTVRLWRCIV